MLSKKVNFQTKETAARIASTYGERYFSQDVPKHEMPEDGMPSDAGGEMDTYTLNFSRGGSTVLAQYYNLIRLGKSGYRQIMTNIMENARWLAKLLKDSGRFEMLDSGIEAASTTDAASKPARANRRSHHIC